MWNLFNNGPKLKEKDINLLVEMGCPRDRAIDALKKHNGDLEMAVNFILQQPGLSPKKLV